MTEDKIIEGIGNDIYDGLRKVEKELGKSLGNKGFITDILSQCLYSKGYKRVEKVELKPPISKEGELYREVEDDKGFV